jgi:hypothetical protein
MGVGENRVCTLLLVWVEFINFMCCHVHPSVAFYNSLFENQTTVASWFPGLTWKTHLLCSKIPLLHVCTHPGSLSMSCDCVQGCVLGTERGIGWHCLFGGMSKEACLKTSKCGEVWRCQGPAFCPTPTLETEPWALHILGRHSAIPPSLFIQLLIVQ